jgi:hypothetical protein
MVEFGPVLVNLLLIILPKILQKFMSPLLPWKTIDKNKVVSLEHIRGLQQRTNTNTTSP